jgi:hypothetical protein
MKRRLFKSAMALVLALAVGSGPVASESHADLEEFAAGLPPEVLRVIRGEGRSRFLQSTAQTLFRYAPDGVLTREAVGLALQVQLAVQRAQYLQLVLNHDLNGDFQLSREEYERQVALADPSIKAQLAVLFAENDQDQDGVLTLGEVSATFQSQGETSWSHQAESLLAFDFNRDGKVDLAEILQVASAVKPEPSSEAPPRTTPDCAAPAVPPGDDVVLLSGHSSNAMSTVALDGQETTTYAGSFVIEEGDTPLYIFAVSYVPLVWSFEGATDRIRTLVIQVPDSVTARTGAAVSGIERERVHFLPSGSCLQTTPTRTGPEVNTAGRALSKALNARVSSLIASYDLTNVQIPSGNTDTARDTEAQARARYATPIDIAVGDRTYRLSSHGMVMLDANGEPAGLLTEDRSTILDMIRMFPAGVVAFDPAALVAPGPVEAYDILPAPAGLLQLMAEGKIETLGGGKYKVIAKINRFPAGLSGQSTSMFSFAEGVSRPDD